MAKINSNYQKLQASYLFSEIAKRVRAFAEQNPGAPIIRLGIGDVVLPLPPPIVEALKAAADEMGRRETFAGYGPEQGYDFLREAIAAHYASQGAQVAADEVFVSDGSKCDTGNIQEIFAIDNVVAVTDPVYPVYVDTNVMAGRTDAADASGRYGRLVYLPTTAENGFDPPLPDRQGRPHLSLLAQQPHRRRAVAGLAGPLGRLRPPRRRRSSCSTPPTRPSSASRARSTASTRSRARARWPSSSAASRRRPASPAPAAPSP